MGRQGGPSLRERAIGQSVHAHKVKMKRLMKGPYMCPRCAEPKGLVISQPMDLTTKKPVHNQFFGRCITCGLKLGPVKGPEALDAYSNLCDLWRKTLQ